MLKIYVWKETPHGPRIHSWVCCLTLARCVCHNKSGYDKTSHHVFDILLSSSGVLQHKLYALILTTILSSSYYPPDLTEEEIRIKEVI